ncbi:hypothetical protein CPB85DRAFT_72233 [Mucidula mucida]|nr:hypothetical protein CPB85DRAFT_72233 [Mucidula mucida]
MCPACLHLLPGWGVGGVHCGIYGLYRELRVTGLCELGPYGAVHFGYRGQTSSTRKTFGISGYSNGCLTNGCHWMMMRARLRTKSYRNHVAEPIRFVFVRSRGISPCHVSANWYTQAVSAPCMNFGVGYAS